MNCWSCRSSRLTHKAKANRNNRDHVREIAPASPAGSFGTRTRLVSTAASKSVPSTSFDNLAMGTKND
jgi:hypothetical protein